MIMTAGDLPVEENKKPVSGHIKFYIMLMLVSIAAVAAEYLLFKLPEVKAVQVLAIVILGQITVIFAYESGLVYEKMFSGAGHKPAMFFVIYMLLIAASVVMSAMPVTAWPIAVIYVLLTIISNIPCGIAAGSVCLFITASSAVDAAVYPFAYVYLLAGISASILVAHLDEKFKIGFPVCIVELILLAGLGVTLITTVNGFSIEMLIYPVVNLAVTLILMLFILKAFSAKVIFREEDKYIELNDPECMLLNELKKASPEDYHKTVHIVYFCDRVSAALGLDVPKVKCAGLYHRVGVIGGQYNWENTRAVCEERNLPEEVMTILKEFEDPNTPMVQPETAVLFMCECIVSSIQYLFAKNSEIKLDYPSLIEAIFEQRTQAGVFKSSDLSIRQYELMKKVFMEEKLYYDFLR